MTLKKSPSTGAGSADVWGLYDPPTGSVQYVCACPETRKAALIDVVQDFDPNAARTDTQNADRILSLVADEGLEVAWILDTHPHADHFTASAYLAQKTGASTAIGAKCRDIAALWAGYYNRPLDPDANYDRLLEDGATVEVGALALDVFLSPGHTLGSITYRTGDAAFVHDTLMYPDSGTSRADFPGGSARELWESIQEILSLPDDTRLFVGHDYCGNGREEPAWEASVAEHLRSNIHVGGDRDRDAFVRLREDRDRTLPLPERMLAALQVNLSGGRLPSAESDGHHYLKIPVNRF